MKLIGKGKVRDIYQLDEDRLLIVTSDRISAFDAVLQSEITNKGKYLNQMALFWFDLTKDIVKNHLSSDSELEKELDGDDKFAERYMIVDKIKMFDFEFIVRDYITGSLWKTYKNGGDIFDYKLPQGMEESQKLPDIMFNVTTKAESGHDMPITYQTLVDAIGNDMAEKIKKISLAIFKKCSDYADEKGIILADTKFEFGLNSEGEIILADEIFTPDSSRFWDKTKYEIGKSQDSYDKQMARNWLIERGLDGEPAELDEDIIKKTQDIYKKIYTILCK